MTFRPSSLFHGSRRGLSMHAGLCLADEESIAAAYAGRSGDVYTVEMAWDGLTVRTVEALDMGSVAARGDSAADIAALVAEGVDVLVYEDQAPHGATHTTYRLLSARALAALTVAGTTADEDEE
jgi:hypothetical protein